MPGLFAVLSAKFEYVIALLLMMLNFSIILPIKLNEISSSGVYLDRNSSIISSFSLSSNIPISPPYILRLLWWRLDFRCLERRCLDRFKLRCFAICILNER